MLDLKCREPGCVRVGRRWVPDPTPRAPEWLVWLCAVHAECRERRGKERQ